MPDESDHKPSKENDKIEPSKAAQIKKIWFGVIQFLFFILLIICISILAVYEWFAVVYEEYRDRFKENSSRH